MEKEPEYYNINPVWGGFKKPRYVFTWKPVLNWDQQITWVKVISPIRSGYRNWDYPRDDIRHYNPLSILDVDL
tara:strand:- start:2326 stop:2544 length:219 start_codon:yes stop_codon:yes gene_type:complete